MGRGSYEVHDDDRRNAWAASICRVAPKLDVEGDEIKRFEDLNHLGLMRLTR